MMRRLMIMRHSKTEKDSPSGKDRDRPLDERGYADAHCMGNYLEQQSLLPDLALVSTARRARQTWDRASAHWPKIATEHRDDLYSADAADLLAIIREARGQDPQRLLVIAHNPGLHELALALAGAGNMAGLQALLDNLPTSGLVIIDFAVEDWNGISFRHGSLNRFVSPRQLKETLGGGEVED